MVTMTLRERRTLDGFTWEPGAHAVDEETATRLRERFPAVAVLERGEAQEVAARPVAAANLRLAFEQQARPVAAAESPAKATRRTGTPVPRSRRRD